MTTVIVIPGINAVHVLVGLFSLVLLVILRIYLLLPSRYPRRPSPPGKSCSLGVFLGSGGHTSEMTTLISGLDPQRYHPRKYILCHGDNLSLNAIRKLETSPDDYSVLVVPRARRVGQSWSTTLLTSLWTGLVALWSMFLVPLARNPWRPWADVLLVNGPGTCVVIVVIAWIRRFLGLPHTRIIYVESFARVCSLSLSAKILRHLVDTFVVQWPDAAGTRRGKNVVYKGWLV